MAGRICSLTKRLRELGNNVSTATYKMWDMTCRFHEIDRVKEKLWEKEEAMQEWPSSEFLIEALRKRDQDIWEIQKANSKMQAEIQTLKEQVCKNCAKKETTIKYLQSEKRIAEMEIGRLRERLRIQDETLMERFEESNPIKQHAKMRDNQITEYTVEMEKMHREMFIMHKQIQDCMREKEAVCLELNNLRWKKRLEDEDDLRSKFELLVKDILDTVTIYMSKAFTSQQEQQQDQMGDKLKQLMENEDLNTEDPASSALGLLSVNPEYAPIFKKYDVGCLLDKGGFGQVRVAKRTADNAHLAIKFAELPLGQPWIKTADQATQVPMEIGLMLLVSGAAAHSGIIQLLDWYIGTTKMAMVMELLDSSMNLTEFIMMQGSSLTEKKAKLIFSQVVEAVRHCHFFWVFHGDLKPDNILIQTTTEKIKLIDFGCGNVLQEEEDYTSYSGSLMYAPPEWFLQSHYSAVPATVWSLGVILFELLCGHCPFIRTDDIVKVKFKFNRDLSAECQDLIKKCFSFSPLERPTLEELQFHPWIF